MPRKIAAIVGAAKGMGFAAALRLGQDYQLSLADMDTATLESNAEVLRSVGFQVWTQAVDVTNRNQVLGFAAYTAGMGHIGAVVNAAGVAPSRFSYEQVFEINAIGAASVQDAFYPYMEEDAVYLNFCSTAPYYLKDESVLPLDSLRLDPLSPQFREQCLAWIARGGEERAAGSAYMLSKWWIRDYTRRSATRFARKGARIVSISPGNVQTPMYYNDLKERCDSDLEKTPIGRHAYPYEIAELIAFLLSPKAADITGVNYQIDGGLEAGLNLPQIEV